MKLQRGYYDVFVRTCAQFPSRIAVRLYEDGYYTNYTYSELYGVCEYVSQNLQQLKCNKGIIGLVSERNIIIPCIIAAAHKCCTTFMFIDPSQDITQVANNISFTIIISIKNKDNEESINVFGKKPDKTVAVFNMVMDFYKCSSTRNQNYRHFNQHSFIARTSGTTGEPKHIQVPIQCIQPNINDLTKMFNITPDDIVYFSTPLTFDPSMVEILLACMNGASLLIAPNKADILFPANKMNSVTFWQTTPSLFFQYSDADIKNNILCADSTLKVLALGGEPLNALKRLKEVKELENKTKIFTLYGVTEMSCWACATELDLSKEFNDREVPLGNCLSETEVIVEPYKNDENTGKIILVSKTRNCYILAKPKGLQEMNSLKFVDTGDLGEVRNGTIYYRGRKDDVIKRFGHKVSLQLIETTIMQCPRVKTCSCIWLPNPMLLVVYFSSESLSSQELSDFLKCKLDDKHWPDKVIRVDNLPTNPHGKISKQMISKMYEKLLGVPHTIENLKLYFLNELKVSLSKNYTYEQIKDKDFFSLGGTSFLAVSLCNKLCLTCPQFAKLIQQYLLSSKHTIGQIIEVAQKDISSSIEETKPRKRLKTCKSSTENLELLSSLKRSSHIETDSPIDFGVVWTFDTGKCVDASPTLFQSGLKLFVTVGSHSGKIIVMDAIGGTLQGCIDVKSRVEAAVLCLEAPSVLRPEAPSVTCLGVPTVMYQGAPSVPCPGAPSVSCMGVSSICMVSPSICRDAPTAGYAWASTKPCLGAPNLPCGVGVVGAHDGTVVCFTLETCKELWRTNIGAMIKSKAVYCNGIVYVAAYDGNLHMFDIMTGEVRNTILVAEQAISADLVLAKNEYIILGTLSSVCASVHTTSHTVTWRGSLSSPVFSSPVLYDRDKYVVFAEVSGEIHCRTVEKGIKIWRYIGAKGNIFSSLYIKEVDKLKWQMVFGCFDNKVYSINIRNFQPSLHWKALLTSPVYCTPCGLSNNLILATSNNGKLCVLDSDNGALKADYPLPNETFSSPVTYGNYIFIGCRDDHLYSLKYTLN